MGDEQSSGKKIEESHVDTNSPCYIHTSEYCDFDPNSSPIPGLNSEQYCALLRYIAKKNSSKDEPLPEANMACKDREDNGWIVDSGCTEHITHRAEWLENKMASTLEPLVMIPNGNSIPVEGKGICHLPNGTTIKGVLHVPRFRCNLLSVSHLSKDHQCSVTFFPDFCFMQDLHSRELIGMGDRLVDFHKLVKTQFGKLIKRIRCDNGGEFVSNRMNDFYAEQGIILETTCPHMPQQNGIVERKHRHLLKTARALRFEANLPKRFWGECVMTAAYIINRLPSKTIDNKTPFEILYEQKPKYEHMKVFGCLAYFRNTDTKGDKFEWRGKPGVFLGYLPGTKGYKIYDMVHNKIVVSRDVRFVENNFPYRNLDPIDRQENKKLFDFPPWYYEEIDETTPKQTGGPNLHDLDNNIQFDNENEALDNEPETLDNGPNDHPQGTHQTENSIQDEVGNVGPQLARPQRVRTQPKRLNDCIVNLPPSIDHALPSSNQQSSTVHPLSNFVSYEKFSDSHKAFLAAITSNDEPKNFKEAVQDQNWRDAMQREIKALEENGTWTIEDLPDGKRAIDSKWVYKIKYKPNGEIERYKARLVAKGFTQREGVDYHDTFAPVAKLVTVRSLLAIAGYDKRGGTKVCRLRKSLYGLKQASRNWYQKFTSVLLELGFKQSFADHSLFTYKRGKVFVGALIYVDDVIIVGNNQEKIQETKTHLDRRFSIKDLGPLKYFLGIEAARTKDGLVLSQRKYTLDILEDSGMLGCKPSSFPMEQNLKLKVDGEDVCVDANMYRRLVGRLLYLQATRPDITYPVNVLSQFVSDPRQSHLDAVMRKSKKQSVVSRSSAEAEYRAMATTTSEILWMRWLLKGLEAEQSGPTPLYCDNQAARHIANNPVFHERTKHVEMDCYFVKEWVESQEIEPLCISTKMQIADLFTKALGSRQLEPLLDKMGMRNLHAPS
ncbi:putative RNA-directed DNA polymerase [Tanacetum coccineum]